MQALEDCTPSPIPAGGVLAADIGGTTTKIARIEATGRAGEIVTLPTRGQDPAQFVNALAEAASALRATGLAGMGVAMAGFLDSRRDRLVYNPNISWLEQYPVRDVLQQVLGMPVTLEIDSNAATLAEYWFGAGRGSSRLLCLTAGTGLGGGMVIDGKILRFAHECIGDAGHIVVEPDGPPCSCGGRGCAEALVGSKAVSDRYATTTGIPHKSTSDVNALAKSGDSAAVQTLADIGGSLGVAAASLCHLLFPDRIVLAGGLSEAGEFLLIPARRAFRNTVGEFPGRDVDLVLAERGWQASLIGAACAFSAC